MQIINVMTDTGLIGLGRRGEHNARRVVFNVAGWYEMYGEGKISLVHQRNGDETPYPCGVYTEGDEVIWNITASDTDKVGFGVCELIFTVNGTVVKSTLWETYTSQSLTDCGGEVPSPEKSWVDAVLGTVGRDGESAYMIALRYGFQGTEKEWIESLKGERGESYIVSDADKEEIVRMMLEALPEAEEYCV